MARAATTALPSYTSGRPGGPLALARDAVYLYRGYLGPAQWMAEALDKVRLQEREIAEALGSEVAGLRMLDVGAGQRLIGMSYFGRRNDMVGVDLDVVVQGFDLAGYARMLRANGAGRLVKTLGRKALLIDSRGRRALRRQLGLRRIPRMDVRQMDASSLAFPAESFDVVYSLEVFSFVSDAAAALAETARVLRPGGVSNHNFLLYTARRGGLDVRTLGYRAAPLPLWAHLRPQHRHLVLESAYLNRLRLPEWRALADEHLPGARIHLWQEERGQLEPEARRLWEGGELRDYDLDELVTTDVSITWRKPGGDA
jgi:SAM-dependent methyltransferase